MKKMIMTIGLPGCGKTTHVHEFHNAKTNFYRLSTDDYVELKASETGASYNEAFSKHIKAAENHMNECLRMYIENNFNIVWDQTNLTSKTRRKKLAKIPSDYKKIALFFEVDFDRIHKINDARKRIGRSIPANVLHTMHNSIVEPAFEEGFDLIMKVKSNYV